MSFTRISVTNKKHANVVSDQAPLHTSDLHLRTSTTTGDTNMMDVNTNTNRRPLSGTATANSLSRGFVVVTLAAAILLGVGTGFGAAALTARQGGNNEVVANQTADEAAIDTALKPGAVFGVADESTFRDYTEGVIIKGGLEGEGSHTLLRPGGANQNVYLTSSVVDLDQFNDIRVRIAGETFKGQKAGWLMDVGRVEVKELNAAKPDWYKPPKTTSVED